MINISKAAEHAKNQGHLQKAPEAHRTTGRLVETSRPTWGLHADAEAAHPESPEERFGLGHCLGQLGQNCLRYPVQTSYRGGGELAGFWAARYLSEVEGNDAPRATPVPREALIVVVPRSSAGAKDGRSVLAIER